MRSPVVWLLVDHPPSKQTGAGLIIPAAACRCCGGCTLRLSGYSRSSKHADGGHPVETVAAHQVGNVILELHLLPGESRPLKQLSPGRVVVLFRDTKAR